MAVVGHGERLVQEEELLMPGLAHQGKGAPGEKGQQLFVVDDLDGPGLGSPVGKPGRMGLGNRDRADLRAKRPREENGGSKGQRQQCQDAPARGAPGAAAAANQGQSLFQRGPAKTRPLVSGKEFAQQPILFETFHGRRSLFTRRWRSCWRSRASRDSTAFSVKPV